MLGYILPLFHLSYWFSLQTQAFEPWATWFVFIVMALLLLAGIFVRLLLRRPGYDKEMRRVIRRSSALLIFAAITGYLLYALTIEQIPVLGMRFFYLVWLASFGAWGYFIARYARTEVPRLRKAEADREAYEKWLPKPKIK
ncbi:MAG TPA: hypothetical protein VFQ60_00600 [Patescibacteria group bacterium]|nr:hypothetical protein [Patescibacteria group bacterium]